jgi:hypothetical protein
MYQNTIDMNDLNGNCELQTDCLFVVFTFDSVNWTTVAQIPQLFLRRKKILYTLLLLLLAAVVVVVAVVKNVQIKRNLYSSPTGPEFSRMLKLPDLKNLRLHNRNS